MSIIKDTFFGGAEKDAARAQERASREAQDIIREQTSAARNDVLSFFPRSEGNILSGFQSALDLFGQSLPAQTQAFQQGNIGAQQQLIAGLPQIQNALFGQPVDFGAFQPTQVQADTSFFQQQLPEFELSGQAQNIGPQQITQPDIGAILGGRIGAPGFGQGFTGRSGANTRFNPDFRLRAK